MKRKVDVSLLGHRFTVRTERDEGYVHSLAANVSRRIEDVRRQMRNASSEEQVLLVALNLADELFEEAERAAKSRAEVRRHTEQMIGKLSAALSAESMGADSLSTGSLRAEEDEGDEIVLASAQRQI